VRGGGNVREAFALARRPTLSRAASCPVDFAGAVLAQFPDVGGTEPDHDPDFIGLDALLSSAGFHRKWFG
jgi:hypothetical protein